MSQVGLPFSLISFFPNILITFVKFVVFIMHMKILADAMGLGRRL